MLFATSSGGLGIVDDKFVKALADITIDGIGQPGGAGSLAQQRALQGAKAMLRPLSPADRVDAVTRAMGVFGDRDQAIILDRALAQLRDEEARRGDTDAPQAFYKKPVVVIGGLALLGGIAFFALRKKA